MRSGLTHLSNPAGCGVSHWQKHNLDSATEHRERCAHLSRGKKGGTPCCYQAPPELESQPNVRTGGSADGRVIQESPSVSLDGTLVGRNPSQGPGTPSKSLPVER